jgi:hypothetical protein
MATRLSSIPRPLSPPDAGINCSCDVHYQQDIVVGFPDRARFEEQKTGFIAPRDLFGEIVRMKQAGTVFYRDSTAGSGSVKNDSRLFYMIEEVRQNYRVNWGLPVPSQVTESFKTRSENLLRCIRSGGKRPEFGRLTWTRIRTCASDFLRRVFFAAARCCAVPAHYPHMRGGSFQAL